MVTQKNTRDRIEEDLQISEAMATSMSSYLDSDVVYYPLTTSTFPKLTLGNFLMRQQRLTALQNDLSEIDKGRLEMVALQFEQAVSRRIARVEQKGDEEAGIRLRQWDQAVKALTESPESEIPYYATTVENRVMLAALITYLQQEPYQFDENILADTAVVDQKLNVIWQSGEFVLSDVWQPAYPREKYWWLYGRPSVVQ